LEDVIAVRIIPAKPGDKMPLQKSNVDVGVDLEAGRDEDGRAGLAIGADDSEDHDTCRVLSFVDRGSCITLVHNDAVVAAVIDLVDGEHLLV